MVAQAEHIPVHLGSMPASVRAVLDAYGGLAPGIQVCLNDPYMGGTHLPDLTIVAAVGDADVDCSATSPTGRTTPTSAAQPPARCRPPPPRSRWRVSASPRSASPTRR